ncbi:hypothetical protein J2Z79_002469 [Symbiobacterium terraclitae]|jgi:hypothetical protein|uniref:DUF2383 domain-containing protein n=1 Tax=Symbiobacterium terraclitae TaxID=557451 RepID=A0ABS4JU40_9FIRM|nr:hypothetical protein [Symbiobacterium terraclitae]MBP2019053.1 hypothetical protein [Symbiobacterium terraclitae]
MEHDSEHRLTDQELMFVQHALDAELTALKKAHHYAAEMEDDNARQLMLEHADIHHRRVDLLLGLLDAPGDITKHAKLLLQSGGRGYHGAHD